MFGEPFDTQLTSVITPLVQKAAADNKLEGVAVHSGKTVVCMEGPQFSTRAESLVYRQWGGMCCLCWDLVFLSLFASLVPRLTVGALLLRGYHQHVGSA
jgi:hypothetical protein